LRSKPAKNPAANPREFRPADGDGLRFKEVYCVTDDDPQEVVIGQRLAIGGKIDKVSPYRLLECHWAVPNLK
jgi:hypothetical protein